MSHRIHPLVAALALAFSGVVFAQANPQVMDTVRVTGQRETPLPNTTAAMNAVEVAGQRAYVSDTAQLLRDVPGVSMYGAGGVPACRRFTVWLMIVCASLSMAWISLPPARIT